jgi:hypothetical protein
MNTIRNIIKKNETGGYRFKPTRAFYVGIGIPQKRFWMIVRGEVDPTIPELKAIAAHFGANLMDLIAEENATA